MRAVGLAVGGVHEHQVDVGAVVQLAAAQLPQRDHRHAALAQFAVLVDVPRHAVARDKFFADALVADVQNRVGEIRELFGGFGQ